MRLFSARSERQTYTKLPYAPAESTIVDDLTQCLVRKILVRSAKLIAVENIEEFNTHRQIVATLRPHCHAFV